MKKHYEKNTRWNGKSWYYSNKYHYYRQIKTKNEISSNNHAIHDRYNDIYQYKIRPRRTQSYLNSWNDFGISKNWKKNWKIFTKKKKQWY